MTKKILIISLVCLLVAGGAITGVLLYMNRELHPFDYVGEDLDKYIYISDENYTGYKGYHVTIAMDEITDDSVASAVNRILAGNRSEAPENDGKGLPKATLAVGDDICLFFRAFTEGEDGERVELSQFSNFTVTDTAKRTYTIGGGSLDRLGLNLELSLVGCDLSKYASCKIITESDYEYVLGDDIVYVTYDALYDGTTPEHASVRLDLSDKTVNKDLCEYLVGKVIGDTLEPSDRVFTSDDGRKVFYRSIKIERALRFPDIGQEPFTVTTTVPATYSDSSLQGKELTFELYIDYAIKYTVPELDEKFIYETLGISKEALDEYEGTTLKERYYAYVRDALKKAEDAEVSAILVEAMWSHLYSIAEIKKLPEDEVERIYRDYESSLRAAFEANPMDYKTFDEYANAYVSYLGATMSWSDYFRAEAEAEVKHKLIFYYVAKRENLLPKDGDFASLASELVSEEIESYLLKNGITRDKYETDAEYNSAAAPYRAEVESVFADEEYLKWVVHLKFAEERMSKFAKVVYKNPAKK